MKRVMFVAVLAVVLLLALSVPALAASTSIDVRSGTATVTAYGPISGYAPPSSPLWGSAKVPVIITPHPAWMPVPLANWISTPVSATDDWVGDTWRKYHFEFTIPMDASDIEGFTGLVVNSDNAEEVWVNGKFVGNYGNVQGDRVDNHEWNTLTTYPFTPVFDVNKVDIIVRNFSLVGGTMATNPTGVAFRAAGDISYSIPAALGGKATGGIKFMAGTTEVQLNFVAMSTKDGAKGNVKYFNSLDKTFWGEVNKYNQLADGTGACFSGDIVKGTFFDEGYKYFYVAVADNGEGSQADPDEGVRVLVSKTIDYPATFNLATGSYEAFTGNVQIHQ